MRNVQWTIQIPLLPFSPSSCWIMNVFEPVNPNYEEEVRAAFARQQAMQTIGARLIKVMPGEVEIELEFREYLTQQHWYLHAGIVTSVVDSACWFAAYSLIPADSGILTVEYKVNLMSPAQGDRFLATGR